MRSLARAVSWFAVLVALVVVGSEIPVVHHHGGPTAGLYNEECPLERLATAPGGAIITDDPDGASPLLALPVPLAPDDPAAPAHPSLPSGSRAPPAA